MNENRLEERIIKDELFRNCILYFSIFSTLYYILGYNLHTRKMYQCLFRILYLCIYSYNHFSGQDAYMYVKMMVCMSNTLLYIPVYISVCVYIYMYKIYIIYSHLCWRIQLLILYSKQLTKPFGVIGFLSHQWCL